MSTSDSNLPSFQESEFKYTNPPNPSWTFGQPSTVTEAGRKWAEEEGQGWKTIDTSKEDWRTLYKLGISGIGPRPIAFVSSIAANGNENLAPFSWFNQVTPKPFIISIACAVFGAKHKDTTNNIKETKGFTVNIISEPWIEQANSCSIDAPPEVSEWTLSGLTKEPSTYVKATRVKESAFTLECELFQIVEIKNDAGQNVEDLILGNVKYIHICNAVLNEKGLVDPAKLKAIARIGDISYVKVGDGFRIPRPVWEEEKEGLQKQFGSAL